ncbi:DNA exonuclease SbcCD subunit SbcD [Williamsia sp. Leaf354]|uniref:exonuclease SbcCD subunit D n=1 Tax=Williamsia sp. Leaf354 TaxID=1736349 RepID=UPI0006F7F7B7|nr:exonuclease SbcCD subunit D [Williamsia sp. Leaf354]KQR97225.1 DNA exonuclease SbcCD subunit SbcD [Williamsia sp. Leaf354]
MRILHTSDWHIGRTFHGVELLDDQRRALADLARLVADERVDVVVVAGDVYDRSVPGSDAVEVYDGALQAMAAAGATLVVTSGNHDSPTRLGAGSSFAAAGGLHLRTTVDAIDEPVVLSDAHGEVAVYGIPYLEPDTVRDRLGVPQARSHSEVLAAAMDRVRGHLAVSPRRSVVLAHAFVVGAVATGSERSIAVGGVETVPADTFDGVDYVALGHLHSPQVVRETVRYSGSPLPYSFGERSHTKAVTIIDLGADGVTDIRTVELAPVRGLSSLRGTLEELLTSPQHEPAVEHYVEASLTDAIRPVDALRRLRTRFPRVVHVEWDRPHSADGIDYRSRVVNRSDTEIVRSFVADVRSAPTPGERALLDLAIRAVVGEPESDRPVELTLFELDPGLTA